MWNQTISRVCAWAVCTSITSIKAFHQFHQQPIYCYQSQWRRNIKCHRAVRILSYSAHSAIEWKQPFLACTHLKNASKWQSIARTRANWPNLIATCRKDVLTMCISLSMVVWNGYNQVTPATTYDTFSRDVDAVFFTHASPQIDWQEAILLSFFSNTCLSCRHRSVRSSCF